MGASEHEGRRERGPRASSSEFARYDQVPKPEYHLAESADGPEHFDEDFRFSTCDLGRFLRGDARDRAAFGRELGAALQEVGFAILEGHGIEPALFERTARRIPELFEDTPLEDKLRFRARRRGAVSEGYFPLRETSDIHPDQVEGWVFGRDAFALEGSAGDSRAFWPRPELEAAFRPWVRAGSALFRPILQSLVGALGCDPHTFDARLERPFLGLRLNHYPPLSPEDRRGGAGRLLAHEDVDLVTLLPAPTVEGLQVLLTSGKWARLDAPPGTIVLNAGDYLQRVSNDLLRSTTHRVSPPRDPALAARTRVSFPLAAYLGPDELIKVLPGLPEPKYEPVKVLTFHTRTTAKFYGDGYAVEEELG